MATSDSRARDLLSYDLTLTENSARAILCPL